jgi:hypothetical protein
MTGPEMVAQWPPARGTIVPRPLDLVALGGDWAPGAEPMVIGWPEGRRGAVRSNAAPLGRPSGTRGIGRGARPVTLDWGRAADDGPSAGEAWLAGLADHHYTLQLLAVRNPDRIRRFVRGHRLAPPYAVYQVRRDGTRWYALVHGAFSSRKAARAAATAFATRTGTRAWIRRVGAVRLAMADRGSAGGRSAEREPPP